MKNNSFFLAFVFILFLSLLPLHGECDCANVARTGVIQSECEILLTLYGTMGGVDWSENQGWNSSSPINNWLGVTVEDSHVTEIILHHNRLTGFIPPELGNLEHLRILELWGMTEVTGGIPPEIGNLFNLQALELRGDLTGAVIPPELGNLLNLQVMYLNCGLTGELPPELGNLKTLRELKFYRNSFNVPIPPELGNLTSLQKLYLSRNQFTGSVPPELANLENLLELALENNQLTEIPPEIGSLTNLRELSLHGNQLQEIPGSIGDLSNLCKLGLGYNQLRELPSNFFNLDNLYYLYLYGNEFSGEIPAEFGQLLNLRTLNLSGNHFSGQIPPEIGNLRNLELLYINGNKLIGPIPQEITKIPDLGGYGALAVHYAEADYNALFTDDPDIQDFMQVSFPGWSLRQTVCPLNIGLEIPDHLFPTGTAPGETSSGGSNLVKLTWDPIIFQDFDGGYEVCLKESAEGSCLQGAGITGYKSESSLVISNLKPGTEYFFEIVSKTYPMENKNPNTVTSTPSDTYSITTGRTAVTAFPLWKMESGNFIGMAFSNYGNEHADFVLTAYDENGLIQSVPQNPSLFSVDGGSQFARIGTEMFGITPDIPKKLSWIEATSDQLAGSFFTFGSTDLRMLDGAVTQSRPSRHLWFSRPLPAGIPADPEEPVEIYFSLVNPMDAEAELTISLVRDNETIREAESTIAAKGMLYFTPEELFGTQALPEDGFIEVKVTEGTGVIGFSRVVFPETKTTLGLNAAEPSSAENLYSAQLASGPAAGTTGMETHIRLVNSMYEDREATFTAVAEDGALLADPVTRTMEARTAAGFRASELFDFPTDASIGSLVVELDAGGVIGDVVFTPWSGVEYAAAMPLQARPVTEAVFNHIANSDEIYNRFGLFQSRRRRERNRHRSPQRGWSHHRDQGDFPGPGREDIKDAQGSGHASGNRFPVERIHQYPGHQTGCLPAALRRNRPPVPGCCPAHHRLG